MSISHFDYLTCEPFRAWNKLENRPRQSEFNTVLRTEIHDPLWMFTRQWQFGEFKGEDTGSAVFAKVEIETTRISKFKNQHIAAVDYDESIPLEARVERMPVNYDLRFRAKAGQHWMRILKQAGTDYNITKGAGDPLYDHSLMQSTFSDLYGFNLPEIDREIDTTIVQVAKARILSDRQTHQMISALKGRSPDGVKWAKSIRAQGVPMVNLPIILSLALSDELSSLAYSTMFRNAINEYMIWFSASHEEPSQESDISWVGQNLEYKFECSLPNSGEQSNTVLNAEEYYSGHLDWFAFDLDFTDNGSGIATSNAAHEAANVKTEVLTIIPAEARFGGMPNSRWWEFEDGATDLGNINAETTNIAKLLLAEFALMYSNDWFVIPYSVPAGSLSEVKGIVVTDTFGERTLVRGTNQGAANDWTSWTMYNMSKNASSLEIDGKTDSRIFIPPVVSKIQESKPIESVEIVRDEMANMVWGVEAIIPDMMGSGRDGNAAAQELQEFFTNLQREDEVIPAAIPVDTKLKFNLGNTVPENWIPFLPIHQQGQNRSIQLQRASMPRWFNSEFSQVRPRTSILREGMNQDTANDSPIYVNPIDDTQDRPYFIFEEEVPRSGVLLESTWQRARWYNGKTVCWYGRRKKVSRGEGASGLSFDNIIDVDYENQEALIPASTE